MQKHHQNPQSVACLPASAASISDSSRQDLQPHGKSKLPTCPAPYSPTASRTGLFFDALNIVKTLQPRWLVLENVTGLLNSNNGQDFQTVIQSLAECGYVGYWRVLDARYFGVPTKRRRVFLVAGLGEWPPIGFMADAGPADRLAGKAAAGSAWADAHPTLLAGFPGGTNIDISGSNICIVADGRGAMVERQRTVADNGLRKGLDAANFAEARAAGNAVVPQVARWIAEKLITTF
nr:DNA cytosine methyltransferase [Neisseria musculi]